MIRTGQPKIANIHNEALVADASMLNEILLQHLQQLVPSLMPGVDGLTIDVILESYVESAIAGLVPAKNELLHRHPEFAEEIESLFATPEPAEGLAFGPVPSPLFFERSD